ncbi:molybdopterin converting factor subunit 1 [Roseibium algae]|uniref:Molybdopterin converting factor subunit 1 n=1 Tax=Roseibium algae TaxID=3123038 RepID=A0ABU8TEU3_9HYPH
MNIRYFAWVREKVGIEEETLDLPDSVKTVADLIALLKTIDDRHAAAFEEEEAIRVALDQMHVEHDEVLGTATEAAFFPPMTGG